MEVAARAVLGYQLQRFGRPVEAVALLERGRMWSSDPLFPHHPGIGACTNLAITQWLLGDFAHARATLQHAVAAAEALEGPTAHFTRAYTHAFAAEMFQVAEQPGLAGQHAGRAVQIATEFGFASWLGAGMTNMKIAEALAGEPDPAIPVIEFCLDAWRGSGAAASLTQFGLGLALAYRRANRSADALTTIDRALLDANRSDERFLEPELHRIRGELLSELEPDSRHAMASLERALAVATTQGARALQLRALVALEQHHRAHGYGRTTLAEIRVLLSELDPTGHDSEPIVERARTLFPSGP